jgi:hypothetical protein
MEVNLCNLQSDLIGNIVSLIMSISCIREDICCLATGGIVYDILCNIFTYLIAIFLALEGLRQVICKDLPSSGSLVGSPTVSQCLLSPPA